MKNQVNKWIDIDHIKGPVTVSKLFVETLQIPINLSLPTTVNNIIILGNSNIGKINDMNMSSFIENVQKVDDKISLEHTIFGKSYILYFRTQLIKIKNLIILFLYLVLQLMGSHPIIYMLLIQR